MKKIIYMITAILLLGTGCSQKTGFLSEDKLEQSAVIHTKKGQLYRSMEIKAAITATYLNPIKREYKNSGQEMFLISVFIDKDSEDPKRQGLFNKDYSLTLNGVKAKEIKVLDFKDDLIKLAPIRNQWSTYYLVVFDRQDNEKLKMIFKNDVYGKVVLEFLKAY
jgi:hypothetical protein